MARNKALLIALLSCILASLAGFFAYSTMKPFELGLDLQGGIHLVYDADLSQIASGDADAAMEGLRDVIERRVNLFGVKEPLVNIEGSGETRRLVVELAGIQDPNQAIQLIGATPFLEFREQKPNFEEIVQKNQELAEKGEQTGFEDPYEPTQLTGRYVQRADAVYDSFGMPAISLQFNDEGSKIFEELTTRNVGKPLAIFLDYQLLQAPVVQEPIGGGKAQITGKFTREEVKRIVRDLNAGALPLPIQLVSQQSVGATLGLASLQQSLKAGLIGFAGVLVFMVLFYRFPGLVAALTLLMYVAFLLALFKLIPVTLTLAGIAGFILSIGMAVDANILIFSRMREELKAGRNFPLSLSEGFRRAWPSIRDGNFTTLLVALVLFIFGSSFVQGFALVLSLGILLSMVTAVFITRSFLSLCINTKLELMNWLWK